ncbi:interleukin 2 receptor, gamma a [Clupea harengus]|uniref:Interleukin 2 receptor, gamma a n=1 Tax=Clupea harengus TaxID=7950 RepID=A0A6P8FXI6_CLUHA|nr:interleukin 2 receptor, gamma a [Clupea harengus]
MMLPLLPLLLLSWSVCESASLPEVSCYIVNLEYVKCTWNQPKAPVLNYTFFAGWRESLTPSVPECPRYLLDEEGVSVGCRYPYSEPDRFRTFCTSLMGPGGLSVNQSHSLTNKVKLNPPVGLRLQRKGRVLELTWEVKAGYKRVHCIQSRVQYALNDNWQNANELVPGSMEFFVASPSNNSQYKLRAQARISSNCGESEWSEWSPLVVWGNRTDTSRAPPAVAVSGMSLVLYVCLAAVVLILLSCLLVHSERLRITLIPMVPNPGKNLTELIDTYNGNVEKWLCISKELQEGFKPTFTERTYPVREYQLLAQTSVESDSGVSLSDSPSPSLCSYSSTSTLPCSPDPSPNGSC